MPSPNEILYKRMAAETYFKRVWPKYRDEAHDFGSHCVLQWFNGRSFETKFYWLVQSYLNTYKDVNGKMGLEDAMVRLLPVDDSTLTLSKVSYQQHKRVDWSHLPQVACAVMTLRCDWGFSVSEIAQVMSQTLREVENTIWECSKELIGNDRIELIKEELYGE